MEKYINIAIVRFMNTKKVKDTKNIDTIGGRTSRSTGDVDVSPYRTYENR